MDTPQRHPLPMGATPYEGVDRVHYVDLGALAARCQEPEPQDMGDALALDNAVVEAAQQSYVYRWYDYRGRGGAA